MEDRCVVCDEIIPEGRMICLTCERNSIKTGMILQSNQATKEEIEKAYDFMKGREENGREI